MKIIEKEKALELRRSGYSLGQIHKELSVSKSTVSVWVSGIKLSKEAKAKIQKRSSDGQLRSQELKRQKRKAKEKLAENYGKNVVLGTALNKNSLEIICSMIYWCEGNKSLRDSVFFTNSDPKLISNFLYLFRNSFNVDEGKFRVCVHIHDYHEDEKQKDFWSEITSIPKEQFIKSYRKPNTKKRIRDNYQGCAQVRYYDIDVARKLQATAKEFMKKYGRVR